MREGCAVRRRFRRAMGGAVGGRAIERAGGRAIPAGRSESIYRAIGQTGLPKGRGQGRARGGEAHTLSQQGRTVMRHCSRVGDPAPAEGPPAGASGRPCFRGHAESRSMRLVTHGRRTRLS